MTDSKFASEGSTPKHRTDGPLVIQLSKYLGSAVFTAKDQAPQDKARRETASRPCCRGERRWFVIALTIKIEDAATKQLREECST